MESLTFVDDGSGDGLKIFRNVQLSTESAKAEDKQFRGFVKPKIREDVATHPILNGANAEEKFLQRTKK